MSAAPWTVDSGSVTADSGTATSDGGLATPSGLFGYCNLTALGQSAAQQLIKRFLALGSVRINAAYFDTARQILTPAALAYRVDDLVGGANIVPWTAIAQPAFTTSIVVRSQQNPLLSFSRKVETHQLLLRIGSTFSWGADSGVVSADSSQTVDGGASASLLFYQRVIYKVSISPGATTMSWTVDSGSVTADSTITVDR